MAFLDEAKKAVNRTYCDVYMKRRYPDGSYDADWIDITRWVTGNISKITYELDAGDYDIGVFAASNVRLTFDNSRGKFSEPFDPRSYWNAFYSRHYAQVKIEAGYIDANDDRSVATPFHGVLDESSITLGDDDTVSATILSRDAVFKRVSVVAGTLSGTVLASEAIFIMCNRSEVTELVTVSAADINPKNDVYLDSGSGFDNKKLDLALNEIMAVTNSVLYVNSSGEMIVEGRDHTAAVKFNFYSNSETGARDNIYAIRNVNSGRHRVKNQWVWSNSALSAISADAYLKEFGTTRKAINTASITNTVVQQDVLDGLLSEWQFPKTELSIDTDYIPGEIDFYDTVTLDVRPQLERYDNLAKVNEAVVGAVRSVDYVSGLHISSWLGWKVLAIEHNLAKAITTLKLRNIGNELNDGYIHMILSKTYSVSFSASSFEDIDTSSEGINAQRAKVEVLDVSNDYQTDMITVSRPDANTIRLTAGGAITDTFRVLVVEVSA